MKTLFLKGLLSRRMGGERVKGISKLILRISEPKIPHPQKAAWCHRMNAAPEVRHSGLSLSSTL